MPLLQPSTKPLIKLRLNRDLVRPLKRGHPWIFDKALQQRPEAPPGSQAMLLDNKKGREVARGFYDPNSPLAFRVCTVEPGESLDETTTGFRLFNGEGDRLPGLICDIYGDTAVIQLDGAGPVGFWHRQGIAEWVAQTLSLSCVLYRQQGRSGSRSQTLLGQHPTGSVPFLENGVRFTADVVQGQKTGFFLDQRENRQRIRSWTAGKRVLNLFGYTGGFSVYAGLGGAEHVTTIDLAAPALASATYHWQLNHLPPERHQVTQGDVFEFLSSAASQNQTWDLVISDPPAFASSQKTVKRAMSAYRNLIAAGARVTGVEGLLAAASCSSHVSLEQFLQACEEGISQARRRATVLAIHGQPADHPTPLAAPELRYLKFVLMQIH